MSQSDGPEGAVTAGNPKAGARLTCLPTLLALLVLQGALGAGLLVACGPDSGSPRSVQAGDVSIPGTATPEPTPMLGSVEGSELQGVDARYQVPVGFDVTLNVQISNAQNKTAAGVLVRSVGGTFAEQSFTAAFGAALARVSFQGASEGVHTGEVLAVFADGSLGRPVLFEVQVGSSTAVATGAVSRATGSEGASATGRATGAENPPAGGTGR